MSPAFRPLAESIRTAVDSEMEFLAVIDDEQGWPGKILFPQAILKFLEKRCLGLKTLDDGVTFCDEIGESFIS